ncbi:hypothetical protein INS49_012838 [Diaporthe citri]|uniref:uncharacterized protein n=1 Tax=Diaporthe citri TaxID=83186 RepID=UPI001C7FA604|nr:uncharacterized protein INS49_012838 [Diaporthe citri]KAG6359317.1 hypothetical protein INS49_012838 [Diaporthe citri]
MALVAPVDRVGFSYAGDSLFREASNLNRHRRATIPELKAHFAGKDTENRPGHWYKAQLLHYGLPPSKVKGTAHKRRRPHSASPQIQKIEADLKKEWNKRDREAKKVLKASEGKGTKRKTDQVSTNVNVNVSVQLSSTGAVQVQASTPPTKRPKVEKSGSAATFTSKKTATAAAPTVKAKKVPATKAEKVNPVPKPVKATDKKPAAKKSAQQPRPPRPSTAQASAYTIGGPSGGYDDAPPPYFEADPGYGLAYQSSPRRGLGLLNGRYEVDCPHMEGNFPDFRDDFGLIATLDGSKLRLKFDLGPLVEIMKVDRPYEADVDDEGTVLLWHGESTIEQQDINMDTFSRAGDANRLHFLGGGHIRGTIAYGWHEIEFDAYRTPGQSMTSEISPSQARAEWSRRG